MKKNYWVHTGKEKLYWRAFSYIFWAMLIFSPAIAQAQTLAFPGAEGFGAYAKGGRGGRVLHVTNLNDEGKGSLRWAIEQEGSRTVVFDISGTITLDDDLSIDDPYITIAGQTAPGDGIALRDGSLEIETHDVVIRYSTLR